METTDREGPEQVVLVAKSLLLDQNPFSDRDFIIVLLLWIICFMICFIFFLRKMSRLFWFISFVLLWSFSEHARQKEPDRNQVTQTRGHVFHNSRI